MEKDAKIRFLLSAGPEINDGYAVVVMNVAVPGAPTDGKTVSQSGVEQRHVGVKKRF